MLTSYDKKKNRFRFADHWSTNFEKWQAFDEFMTELAEDNSDEFSKPLYSNNRFIVLLDFGGHCYDPRVPEEIQKLITAKLKELFF